MVLMCAALAGGAAALATSFIFMKIAYANANTVVHVALMLGPAIMIISGIATGAIRG